MKNAKREWKESSNKKTKKRMERVGQDKRKEKEEENSKWEERKTSEREKRVQGKSEDDAQEADSADCTHLNSATKWPPGAKVKRSAHQEFAVLVQQSVVFHRQVAGLFLHGGNVAVALAQGCKHTHTT